MLTRRPQLRNLRLQFSLRAVLLVMLLLSIALTVYRRPWQETSAISVLQREVKHVFTYRRGWRGSKERHGVSWVERNGRKVTEHLYVDDELRRTCEFNEQGQITQLKKYASGHNSYFACGDGRTWVRQFNHAKGQRQGESQEIINRRSGQLAETNVAWSVLSEPVPDDPIRVVQSWRANQRHGLWTWQTLQGQVLQTTTYQANELVEWNGQPIVEQFRAWLREQSLADTNLLPMVDSEIAASSQTFSANGFSIHWNSRDHSRPGSIRVMVDAPLRVEEKHFEWFTLRQDESLAAALCELIAAQGYHISYRYGLLWLASQDESESLAQDRTGIDSVSFETGSSQEKAWNEPITLASFPYHLRDCLRNLMDETEIELDLQQLDQRPYSFYPNLSLSRRNWLGYLLYVNGLRCEQSGNKLIIVNRYKERS